MSPTACEQIFPLIWIDWNWNWIGEFVGKTVLDRIIVSQISFVWASILASCAIAEFIAKIHQEEQCYPVRFNERPAHYIRILARLTPPPPPFSSPYSSSSFLCAALYPFPTSTLFTCNNFTLHVPEVPRSIPMYVDKKDTQVLLHQW